MERLQKVMAHAGVDSRRKCEKMIQDGRVKVNGKVTTELGVKVTHTDRIEVDNIPIDREEPVYFLLNKPRRVITAVSDDKGRTVVTDLFPEVEQRIYPVGRLDYDTTGALILTNDGEFSQLLMHPKYEISKVYVAKVEGLIDKKTLRQLDKGVVIEGRKTAPAKTKLLSSSKDKKTSMVQMTIHEGRNRQVKKMFEAVGHPVQKLTREMYGNLSIAGLQSGEWRELKNFEVQQMKNLAKESTK